MPTNHEDELRAIWQSQLTAAAPMTSEQLRARAEQLESKARRSIRTNQISAAIVAMIVAASLFLQEGGLLFNLGKVMMLVWAVYVAWGMKYFFAPLSIPTGANAGTCASLHKRQLERQRDLNLSIRSGVRPVLLGALLVFVGTLWPSGDSYPGPEALVVLIAVAAILLFLREVMITWGEIVARRFQQEIDELDSMIRAAPW